MRALVVLAPRHVVAWSSGQGAGGVREEFLAGIDLILAGIVGIVGIVGIAGITERR